MRTVEEVLRLKTDIDEAILDRLYGDVNDLPPECREDLWGLRMDILRLWNLVFPLNDMRRKHHG